MEEGCSCPAEPGTRYLSSRHLDEIAEPMQRRLASLQPGGSVSRNDRRRNRQERSATQQTVTTDGRDYRSWLPFGPAKGLIGAASRQGERKPRSPHWSLPSSRAFFYFPFFSSPRPVHMVIIIIPPSQLPTLWSLSSRTPPTNQDGQATAWFARRLFCWFVRCHCHFPFEVRDSTLARPGLDIDHVLDLFGSVPDLRCPEPDPTRIPSCY